MKICGTHFDEVKKALIRKGLGHLIKDRNGEQLSDFAVRWLLGTATMEEFDPLVVAILEITNHAKIFIGMQPQDHRCPLCGVTYALGVGADDKWVDNVTDLMLLTSKVNGLA